MAFTAKDIQVFILTYNRPDMFKQALQSVLNQTVQGFECYVMDNSTNAETEDIIKNYPSVKYVKTDPKKTFANFLTMQELMSAPYILTLHDDDLLHPEYMALALDALNKIKDITFIGSKHKHFYNDNIPVEYTSPKKLKKNYYLITTQPEFAMSFWAHPMPQWTGSIIKSEQYKKMDITSATHKYGKISDWPMLIQAMEKGNAVIFLDICCSFYRHHKGQDTHNDKTGAGLEQIANWIAMFKSFAYSSPNKRLRNIYFLHAPGNAKRNWEEQASSLVRKEYPVGKFYKYLYDKGLVTPGMLFYSKRKKNLFYRIATLPMKLYYKRHFYKKAIHKLK